MVCATSVGGVKDVRLTCGHVEVVCLDNNLVPGSNNLF